MTSEPHSLDRMSDNASPHRPNSASHPRTPESTKLPRTNSRPCMTLTSITNSPLPARVAALLETPDRLTTSTNGSPYPPRCSSLLYLPVLEEDTPTSTRSDSSIFSLDASHAIVWSRIVDRAVRFYFFCQPSIKANHWPASPFSEEPNNLNNASVLRVIEAAKVLADTLTRVGSVFVALAAEQAMDWSQFALTLTRTALTLHDFEQEYEPVVLKSSIWGVKALAHFAKVLESMHSIEWLEEGFCESDTFAAFQDAFLAAEELDYSLWVIDLPHVTDEEIAAWHFENRPGLESCPRYEEECGVEEEDEKEWAPLRSSTILRLKILGLNRRRRFRQTVNTSVKLLPGRRFRKH